MLGFFTSMGQMPTCQNGVHENTHSYFLKNAAQLLHQMTEPTVSLCPVLSIVDSTGFCQPF